MLGMLVGVVRLVLDFVYREPACGQPDLRPAIVGRLHYMYFAMLLFWVSGIVMVIVSLLSQAPPDEQVRFDVRSVIVLTPLITPRIDFRRTKNCSSLNHSLMPLCNVFNLEI